MKYELQEKDYLDLWIYFEERATNVKGAMFNTITWIIGFAAAILGFIFFKLGDFDPWKALIEPSVLVVSASGAGLVICLYAFFALGESAKHIRINWSYADEFLKEIPGLERIIKGESRGRGQVVPIWKQLQIVVAIFTAAFLGLLIWGFYI